MFISVGVFYFTVHTHLSNSSSVTFTFFKIPLKLYLPNLHSTQLSFHHTQTHTLRLPCVPFPAVRVRVVTSPVVVQRAGAVPNMDFLLFPLSFPLLEPAGDSVDRPGFPHKRDRQQRVVNSATQTERRHGDRIYLPSYPQLVSQNAEIILYKSCHFLILRRSCSSASQASL